MSNGMLEHPSWCAGSGKEEVEEEFGLQFVAKRVWRSFIALFVTLFIMYAFGGGRHGQEIGWKPDQKENHQESDDGQ